MSRPGFVDVKAAQAARHRMARLYSRVRIRPATSYV
jgi:hypothetical protein